MFHQSNIFLLFLPICSICSAFNHVDRCPDLISQIVRNLPATTTAETTASMSSAQSSILAELQDECLLWNSSCSGNRAQILSDFFGNTGVRLSNDACFHDSSNCSVAIQKVYGEVKDWMKSPQCGSSQIEWEHGARDPIDRCCLQCDLEGGNVDIYYWPDPDSDTSCLSIVGNSVYPVDYGATTVLLGDIGNLTVWDTVWVCTTKLQASVTSTVTTAVLTSQLGIVFKLQNDNPWSLLSCTENFASSPVSSNASAINSSRASLRARGHSLIVSPSTKTRKDAPVTVTSGSFTL